MSETNETVINQLKELGFESLDEAKLVYLCELNKGERSVTREDIMPEVRTDLDNLSMDVRRATNNDDVWIVPAGYSLGNWEIEEALSGKRV